MINLKIRADFLCYVARFISYEPTRYNLQGVHFNEDGSIVATDGHRLGLLKFAFDTTAESESISNYGFTIEFDKNLLKVLKQQKDKTLEIVVEGCSVKIICDNLILNAHLVDGNFPEWRKVIPESNPTNKINWIALNPNYLADFGGFKKADRLKLEFGDSECCPIRIYNDALPTFLGVLMPCRF